MGWPVVKNEIQRRAEIRWRRHGDFRVICDCQHHARKKRRAIWGRAARIGSSAVAALLSIPLAFAAMDIPQGVMDMNILGGNTELRAAQLPSGALPIFTTRTVRDQFFDPPAGIRSLTIDMFKEAYFREHVPYGEIIFREARRNDLSPELVAAMVHTESDFRTTLVSSKHAQGLMQIVPSTARHLGIDNPFDPEQNIAAGTKYFRYLLDRFENESMALAAYNAGEGNVERFGGIPPFAETRDYIVKVNRRTDRYRQRVHNTYLATMRIHREALQ